jgi:chemotaxis protein methyltransferase CheR
MTSLEIIASVVHEAVGVRVEADRHPALRAALARAWPGVPHAEIARRTLDPATAASTLETLVDEITIKETSFLRDHRQLESIDWTGLQALAAAQGSPAARVWSAACASGEEPYSLALLACEAFASATPPVTILASDVSHSAIASAVAASYRERAVANVGPDLRERYFTRRRDNLEVVPALRRLVSVTQHNLVADACPPAGEAPFHLILCRNVLIYFDGETCSRVVSALEGALAPGGRLVLGAADALCVLERAAAEFRLNASLPVRRPAPQARRRRHAKAPRLVPPAPTPDLEDAMNPELHYLHGIDQLESGDARAAIESLRRVLYLDSDFELAAFALGRAHEEAGEPDAARRRYQQALRLLRTRREPAARLHGAIDAAAVMGACEARLTLLSAGSPALRESA